MELDSCIYVAGHNGLVGSAVTSRLKELGYTNVIGSKIDLRVQKDVINFFQEANPKYVFLCAAVVGGIKANIDHPATFIMDNLLIQTNVIDSASYIGVERLIFLGSACIYPLDCDQPINESCLLTGKLEPTNRPYSVAKIAGVELCKALRDQYECDFVSVMPCNLYGHKDNFDDESSHVIPSMLKKLASGNNKMWGTGASKREFLHSNDLAAAIVLLMEHDGWLDDVINIGSGRELTIKELAVIIAGVVGYDGEFEWGLKGLDGMPRRLLDSSYIKSLGWTPNIQLEEGIAEVYKGMT